MNRTQGLGGGGGPQAVGNKRSPKTQSLMSRISVKETHGVC